MRVKVCKDVIVTFEFEILTADFYGDNFLICQGRIKYAATQSILFFNDAVLLANKQKKQR